MSRLTMSGLLAAAVLAGGVARAGAATAHNSQAGAYGPNTHTCEATPYFPAGGCLSAAIGDDDRYPFVVGPRPAPPRGRLIHRPAPPTDDLD